MTYYLYAYLDPRKPGEYVYEKYKFKFEPFYIGKGSGNRATQHMESSELSYQTPKANKIKKLLRQQITPIVEIFEHIEDENEAYRLEEKIIKLIGSDFIEEIKDGPLTNMQLTHSKPPNLLGRSYLEIYKDPDRAEFERRRRHENQLKAGGWFKGKHHTVETRKNFSMQRIGNQHRLGYKESEETKAKLRIARSKKLSNTAKFYVLENNGKKVMVYLINQFCIEHGINLHTLKKQIYNNKNYTTLKGWKIIEKISTLDKTLPDKIWEPLES